MKRRSRLLPYAVYPPRPVLCLRKVLFRQVAQVAECDARERRKQEHVTHKVQVGLGQRGGNHPFQIPFRQETGNKRWIFKRVSEERVLPEQSFIEGGLDNPTQIGDDVDNRVTAHFQFRSEIKVV